MRRGMKKSAGFLSGLLLLLLLCSGTSFADGHILWSVKFPGNTIYFLGSLHVLKPDAYPLPRAVERIYDCCDRIVFETDMGEESAARLQSLMMSVGRYPSGQKLRDNISRKTYSLLRAKATSAGVDLRKFESYRPWFVAIALAGIEFQRLGFDTSIGIDRYFFRRAKQDGKRLIFLETNQYQLNLFAGLNARRQEELLRQMLNEVDVINSEFSSLWRAWKTGDAEGLARIIREGFKGFPSIYRRFIVNRNRRWIGRIEKLVREEGDVLVIVGSAHLTGKDSIIEMLRKRGYRVRKL
jgi:hypothetical protein